MGLDNGGSHITDPVSLARAKVECLRYELAQAEQQLAALVPEHLQGLYSNPYRRQYEGQ